MEPNYSSLTRNELTILGQTNIWIKKVQEIEALVCKEESDESPIDLDSLQDMGIIHNNFPLPMKKNLRESTKQIRLVSSENKRNQTKLVNTLEIQVSKETNGVPKSDEETQTNKKHGDEYMLQKDITASIRGYIGSREHNRENKNNG